MISTIVKSGIFYKAKLLSYQFSDMLSLSNELVASKLAISSEDSELIYSFLESALGSLVESLPPTSEMVTSQESYILTIPTEANFSTIQTIGIDTEIKDYLVNFVLNEWYKLLYPERCQFHILAMEQNRTNIHVRLNKRTEPVRRGLSPW